MSKTKTDPLALLMAPFRFLGSLSLGIFLLVALLVLMALATFIESEYGSAVSAFVVYGNHLFHFLIAFLALNLSFSVLLRFPWGKYHIPFLFTHVGILILLFGCYLTLKHGVEAQITLPEGAIGTVAVKPEHQQLECKYIVHTLGNAPELKRFPMHLGPFSWQDYQYENWFKDDGKRFKTLLWYAMKFVVRTEKFHDTDVTIDILDYYAHSTLEPVPPFDVSVLWKKAIQTITELGEPKEIPRNWEMVRLNIREQHGVPGLSDVRGISRAMSQGERISYTHALSQEELTAFQKSRPSGGTHSGLWGEIVFYYGGNHYSVNADHLVSLPENSLLPMGNSGLQIGDIRFNERGPIIRFTVSTPSGEKETMALMPDNPEMNIQARRLGIFGSYWVDPGYIMQQSASHADNPMLKRLATPRLDFMQGSDKKLYYRLWSGQKIVADGVVPDREGQKKPQFKVAVGTPNEAEIVIDRFVPQDVLGSRIVLAPTNRIQHNEQRLKLRVSFDGNEDTFWIRAVAPMVNPLPSEQDQVRYIYGKGRTLQVQFNFETIDLGFGIMLKEFEKRTDPGTQMPSHYSSLVDYVESINPKHNEKPFSWERDNYRTLSDGKNILISMNQPGYFSGKGRDYRIYQSSYLGPFYPDQPQFSELYDGKVFPWETRPRESIAMSTLSVNVDQGRGWKYFGCLLIVIGVALFIWRNRW